MRKTTVRKTTARKTADPMMADFMAFQQFRQMMTGGTVASVKASSAKAEPSIVKYPIDKITSALLAIAKGATVNATSRRIYVNAKGETGAYQIKGTPYSVIVTIRETK